MSKKIGFNNFKAFGPQMQYFTQKPITLIYGPNSVGKSSLLHAQLMSSYFMQNEGDIYNFKKISFAGDELDLGGFDNFIHKHNSSELITFENIINDQKDILRVFNIENLLEFEILDEYLNMDLINEKLDSNYKSTGIKFKYLFETIVNDMKFKWKKNYSQFNSEKELDLESKQIEDLYHERNLKMVYDYFNDPSNVSQEELEKCLEVYFNAEEDLKKSPSALETIMFATLHTEPAAIVERIQFFKKLKEISEIKITKITSNKEGFSRVSVHINNQLLFEEDKAGIHVNTDNNYLQANEKLVKNLEIILPINEVLSKYSDFNFNIALILGHTLGNEAQSQYFGPIRPYPKRSDLYNVEPLAETKDSMLKKFARALMKSRKSMFIGILLLGIPSLYYSYFISSKSFFEVDYIGMIFPLLLLLLVIIGIYNKLKQSDYGKEILNSILPKPFQLLRDKVISSYDIWKILAQSNETVDKLNIWLGNNEKLKSNYVIKVVKNPITYLGVFRMIILQLFNLEKGTFSHNKFSKSITNLWNFFERKMGIKQRYESQIIFTDISKNTDVTPREMGLGISQMLPILISTFNSKDSKIFLEQPELHLHPAVQMELMDEFIRSAKENTNEFLIETHSEHMLLRIMKRMRYTAENKEDRDKSLDLNPDDVCVLYVNSHKGKTFIKEIKLAEDGSLLSRWPKGFFEESYKEMFL